MSTLTFKQKDIFNQKLYISPLTCSYFCQSPEKDKSETDDNSDSSPMKVNELSSPFSTEKKKSEACLTTELLNLLDECSPVKLREAIIKEEKEEGTTYVTEKNYLLEEYLSKENKENKNTTNIIAIVPKKLTFTPIENDNEIQGKKIKPSFYKSKKGNKHLYSDTMARTQRVSADELKDMDIMLDNATYLDEAPHDPTHNNPFDYFYYFKATNE